LAFISSKVNDETCFANQAFVAQHQLSLNNDILSQSSLIPCLHNEANMRQTWSKLRAHVVQCILNQGC